MSVRFDYNRRGGLTVDRDSLHESEGYKRQVEALKQLPERKAAMGEKMDSEREAFEADYLRRFNKPGNLGRNPDGTYGHSMTQARWDAWKARSNLTQPAQAVDVGAIREVVFWLTSNSHWISGAYEQGRKLTAALPNANGKEG